MICVVSVLAVSCGVKDGPYLPKQVLSKSAKNFQALVRSKGVLLRWNAPESNTDGTPLLDLGGFRIFRADTEFEKICLYCSKSTEKTADFMLVPLLSDLTFDLWLKVEKMLIFKDIRGVYYIYLRYYCCSPSRKVVCQVTETPQSFPPTYHKFIPNSLLYYHPNQMEKEQAENSA